MPKTITFEGAQHTFPDDATDDEIAAVLDGLKPWAPGQDSLSAHMARGPEVVSDTPTEPSALSNLVESPLMQGAAHPKGVGDILPLLVPGGIQGAISGGKTLAKSFADIVPGTGALAYPRALMRRVVDRFTSSDSLADIATAKAAKAAEIETAAAVKAQVVPTAHPTNAAPIDIQRTSRAYAGEGIPAAPVEVPLPVMHGPSPKPRLSAAEVAAELRKAHGSERAGKMLYGNSKGGNVISPAARKDAIQRLAPGSSKLPDTNRAMIIKKMEGMSLQEAFDYAKSAPSAVAQEFFAELLKRQ